MDHANSAWKEFPASLMVPPTLGALKRRLLPQILHVALIATALGAGANPASAGPWGFDSAELDVSDQVITNGEQPAKVTVTIRGLFTRNYGLAVNTSPKVINQTNDNLSLAPGAVFLSQGRIDRDGEVSLEITLPRSNTGKVYLQAYTTKRWWNDRDTNLSPVKVVTILKDALGTIGIKGDRGGAGPAGPQGPIGLTGPTGPQGNTGPQGPAGAVGAMGPQGPIGLTGPAGAPGARGEKGDTGDIGPAGPAGPQGDVGPAGPQGDTGPQGPIGLTGAIGATGARGEKGETGDVGPAGPAGPQGAKGDRGETGAVGLQGPQGPQGDTGPQGPAGAVGPMGPQGAKGDSGETGAIGATGARGEKGDTGDVGPAGPAGPQGAKGDRGETGAVGPQGPQGDTGPEGPQGPQGIAGVTPELKCPTDWLDLGPTCIQPNFSAVGTVEQAINDCYSKGARVCEHQDLAFACSNRANLNLAFPDDTWLLTGSVILRALGTSSSYVAYTVYRRVGSRCFGPSTINPTDGVVSYELSTTPRNYTCCAERSF
jgi:hypothetical protein